ncbi:MAG: leucine-rich repeat protein, partial [Muribaculaceae bacterium]|nr:leucine-rich repeat protein [Muribaculaceae bacterium]
MKRLKFHRAIVAIAMMLIGWLPSLAYDFEVDGICYNIISSSDKTVEVTFTGQYSYQQSNYNGDIKIPESISYNNDNYIVTSIGKSAFFRSRIKSLSIPRCIHSINNSALNGCDMLESIVVDVENDIYDSRDNCNAVIETENNALIAGCITTVIPYSVTSIGDKAFYECEYLQSIQIPNGVVSIGNEAFRDCVALVNIIIPDSINNIGTEAFYNTAWFKNLDDGAVYIGNLLYGFKNTQPYRTYEIKDGTTHICNSAFSDCYELYSISIPNTVISIGDKAFEDCRGLSSINIPNSVTHIGREAFSYCYNLKNVGLSNAITNINSYLFYKCTNLTNIVLPSNIISIEDCAFSGCSSLTSIEIPNSVTSIGSFAFDGCSALENIIVPNTVTEIGSYAFRNCSALTNFKLPDNLINISDGIFSGCSKLAHVEIPNSVKSIGSMAFEYTPLSSITIPFSIKSIGQWAFRNCYKINSVHIDNLISWLNINFHDEMSNPIYYSANLFVKGNILTDLVVPDSIVKLNSYTFINCSSISNVILHNSFNEIGNYAFNGCSNLTNITCLASNPPTIQPESFSYYDINLYVPKETLSIYKSHNNWSNFKISEIIEPSKFSIEDFIINSSELQRININLKNDIAFTGFQADLYLPEGLEVVAEDGNYSFELTDRKGSNHVLSAVKQSNGAIRLLCYSLTNKEFIGNEGALVKFSVKASDDFVGEHEISIKDIEFTQKDETKHELEPTTAKVEGRMLAKSITLNKTEVSLEVTQTITLKATVLPESTYNKVVTWKSSDETIATVDENGVVIAVKLGEATITATTTDGTNLSASCKVTVKSTLATSIALDKTEVELEATQTATISATILPELTTNKTVTWKSSDEKIATVDGNGVVTAIAVGEATITATTTDGSNLFTSCKVTVKPTLATSITLDKTEVSLKATEMVTLVATVLPELTTDKSVTWKSSNNTVAIVSENGVATAVATGEAIITATTTDGSNLSASAKIIIDPTIAESITLNIESTTLKANETIELIANVLPELTTNKSVTWKSSDEAVAIVDTNGLVTAIGVGTATITATTIDGSNLSASCIVTVEATLGDANNDAIINVTDVVNVASYILGQNPDTFIFEAADINKDSKISVTDIVAIVNIILNSEITNEAAHYARAAKQQALGSCLFIDDTSIEEGETMQLAVNLTNDIAFSGFQADIKLPEGLELCQEDGEYLISLSDRKGNDHVLASAVRSDGTIRVLSYSMNLKDYTGTEGALIYLTVKATDNFVGDHEICINNIAFVKADLTEYSLESSVCHLT